MPEYVLILLLFCRAPSGWCYHVAVKFPDGTVFEALPVRGVTSHPDRRRRAAVAVRVTRQQAAAMRAWAEAQVGKRYHWRATLLFPTRYRNDSGERLMCSELVCRILRTGGVVAAASPSKVSPHILYRIFHTK